MDIERRDILRLGGLAAAAAARAPPADATRSPADHTLRIGRSLVELAADTIVSTNTYNGQFPGPLLRMQEGRPVTVDIHNDTDHAELVHWHGQKIPAKVDGAAEEGTPLIPAHGSRREMFTPGPSGFRFYHTHVRAGADLDRGMYSGLVGPVYIAPRHDPGAYDQEVFLVLKEFGPTFSRGGDMAQDFLAGAEIPSLKQTGETAMRASRARGMPVGYEVGYQVFAINGRMLGHGAPLRVKAGQRLLLHVLNGSAGEIRSLALPGHRFRVLSLDGNLVPTQAEVPVLWLGTAERISAVVEMDHPGVWVLGDLSDDDRGHGMGIVVEYAGAKGPARWATPPRFLWDYTRFGTQQPAPTPDAVFDMVFAKHNAEDGGFNRWTINNVAYPHGRHAAPPMLRLTQGRRYRLRMRNASDDIHPIHLHRHSCELTRIAGKPTAGVLKDVVMLGGYQEAEVDFVADNPGPTLFHCHQQLHMDYGFMALFDYA
ncbi:multicopper oxidase family protein [Lichenicoccus sp.]|uniref:multicopper oxidase family protein n=1 Tax=Lichenicoccus sp. TaxID=2781899 RepID=UPI003D0A1033